MTTAAPGYSRDDIRRKAADIAGDVRTLEQRAVMFAELHGSDGHHQSVADQVAFQRARLEAAEWACGASDDEVRAAIRAGDAELGPWISAKHGPQVGVPPAITRLIARVELFELAVGAHPVQQRRS